MARFKELCLDTSDPDSAIAEFWAAVAGVRAEAPPGERPLDVVGDAEHQGIAICPVPEPKTVKNRLHWDVYGTVEEFLDLGATRLWDTKDWGWVVLADPDGNEFCVFPEPSA